MSTTFDQPKAPWALRLIPPFPLVAQQIMALASKDNSSAQQVARLVRTDPSFSAEMLRFANSALFGARHSVSGLAQAIVLLGMDRVKTMATMVVMNRMVRSSIKIQTLRKVWIHSLATALIAEAAAPKMHVGVDTGYTAGLLHNLGCLGLMSAYPEEYSRMLEVSNDYGFDLLKTERDLFEIDHCAAGAYLAQEWDFPDELAASIATHHDEPVPGTTGLESLVQISWRLADTLGYTAFSPQREWGYDELLAYLPNLGNSWLGKGGEEATAELAVKLQEATA